MEFEKINIGDYCRFTFMALCADGKKRFRELYAFVKYKNDSPDFVVIVDNDKMPYLILRSDIEKIKREKPNFVSN